MEKELTISQKISVETTPNIVVIRFTNPKERNPLSIEILDYLHQLADDLAARNKPEKIIFTGTGDVFASGANLREIVNVTGETAREYALRGQNLMRKITQLPNETIAFSVDGACFRGIAGDAGTSAACASADRVRAYRQARTCAPLRTKLALRVASAKRVPVRSMRCLSLVRRGQSSGLSGGRSRNPAGGP